MRRCSARLLCPRELSFSEHWLEALEVINDPPLTPAFLHAAVAVFETVDVLARVNVIAAELCHIEGNTSAATSAAPMTLRSSRNTPSANVSSAPSISEFTHRERDGLWGRNGTLPKRIGIDSGGCDFDFGA